MNFRCDARRSSKEKRSNRSFNIDPTRCVEIRFRSATLIFIRSLTTNNLITTIFSDFFFFFFLTSKTTSITSRIFSAWTFEIFFCAVLILEKYYNGHCHWILYISIKRYSILMIFEKILLSFSIVPHRVITYQL